MKVCEVSHVTSQEQVEALVGRYTKNRTVSNKHPKILSTSISDKC